MSTFTQNTAASAIPTVAVAFAALFLVSQARAALVTHTFTGITTDRITYIANGSGTAVEFFNPSAGGLAVSGTFTYETAGAVDSNPLSTIGDYIVTGTLQVTGAASYTSSGPLSVQVKNHATGDQLTILDPDSPDRPANGVDGQGLLDFVMAAEVLNSTALPTNLNLPLGDVGALDSSVFTGLSSIGFPFAPNGTVLGSTDVFDVTSVGVAVPEPAAAGLLTLAMGLLRRRRRVAITATAATVALSLAPSTTAAADLFFDDFSNFNAAGWTIGSEWQIGATFQSPSPATGNPDPAFDHSPTADNGVAGALLGGNVTINQHDFFFFTSPVINTDVPEPIVSLEYFRWLNGDNTPFMNQVIEVFDGTQFQRVFETGANPPADAQWTFHQMDLTAYKNSQMRIRFGHNVAASGAFTVSGWNIDDVAVVAVPEPAFAALAGLSLLGMLRRRARGSDYRSTVSPAFSGNA